MKLRHLLIAFTMTLVPFAASPPATNAASLGIAITVLSDSGSGFVLRGTAADGGTIDVPVNVNDTVRFVISVTNRTDVISAYETRLTLDDPTEIDYAPGTGLDLSGLNFALFSSPDDTLDPPSGSPPTGDVNSAFGESTGGNTLFQVDFTVQSNLNSDAGIDFSVELLSASTVDFGDVEASDGTQIANVRVSEVPEPGTLLLLGCGLAGLACFSRRKNRH